MVFKLGKQKPVFIVNFCLKVYQFYGFYELRGFHILRGTFVLVFKKIDKLSTNVINEFFDKAFIFIKLALDVNDTGYTFSVNKWIRDDEPQIFTSVLGK